MNPNTPKGRELQMTIQDLIDLETPTEKLEPGGEERSLCLALRSRLACLTGRPSGRCRRRPAGRTGIEELPPPGATHRRCLATSPRALRTGRRLRRCPLPICRIPQSLHRGPRVLDLGKISMSRLGELENWGDFRIGGTGRSSCVRLFERMSIERGSWVGWCVVWVGLSLGLMGHLGQLDKQIRPG